MYVNVWDDTDPDEAITADMIEAGALELARYDARFENDEEAAIRIYQAMISARASSNSPS